NKLDDHRTMVTHGDIAAQWTVADRGRRQRRRLSSFQRGAIRPVQWDLDGDRSADHRTRVANGDVAARWASADGGRLRRYQPPFQRGAIRSGQWDVDHNNEPQELATMAT